MKVRYIGKERMDYIVKNNSMALIPGKIYEVLHTDEEHSWYGIIDEAHDGEYGYPAVFFEVVEQ